MLKVLGSLIPFASLSIGTISLAAPVTQPPVSNQSTNPKNSSPVNVKSAQQPSPSLPRSNPSSSNSSSSNSSSSNASESLPNLVQSKQVCGAKDLSFLEQGLAPRSAELQALPQTDALAVPQQPPAVAIQQTLSLELPAAVRYAFDRNPDLQVTKLQLQRSCEQLKQVKAANYPTLSLASSFSRTDGGSFSPRNRVYGTNPGDQQQIQQQIQQEQSTAQQELQQQISTLQTRFQQTSTQVQTNTLQQQITQLQQRVSLTVLSDPVDITPLTPSAVSLPLRSGTSSGGVGGYFNGSLNLSYSIYTGGQRSASIQVAERQIENSALAVQLQFQQLRQDVTSRYIDLQQTQSLIGIANSAIASAQETLRTTQLGEQAGTQTRFEVLQAAVTLADAQQNLTQANALFTIARRQLVQQIGLPDTVDVTLPDTVRVERAGSWSPSLEETIILALNNRIELTQTRLQRRITELQKRIVRSQKLPRLQGFASLNLADDLEDRVLGAYGYAVGVQANFNVFDGGSVRSQLRQLDETLRITDQQFNQLRESIRFQVEQAYFSLQTNATNIETSNQALAQAQEALRLAQLRFSAGVGTSLEVTRAQADLTQAQGNQVAAVLDYNRALSTLESATGYAAPVRR
jgi:outer membrane factor, OMF family